MTAPAVTKLREQVRLFFEPNRPLKKILRRKKQLTTLTGETSAQVSHRVNATFFRYLDAKVFENVLCVLEGENAAREAAHLVTYLRNSENLWLQIRSVHPRKLLDDSKRMFADRERALNLLAEAKKVLSANYEQALDAILERAAADLWPVRSTMSSEHLMAASYDNDTFAPGADADSGPRTKRTFNLEHVGRRGASTNRESAWRALRIRALDERLPAATISRNATIAGLLNLGEEHRITRQLVAAILKEKPKLAKGGRAK